MELKIINSMNMFVLTSVITATVVKILDYSQFMRKNNV